MQDDQQAYLSRVIQYCIQCPVVQAGGMATDLCRDELLVNGELTNTTEHAGIGQQHVTDVIGGMHVGGIKTGDHGIEAFALFFIQAEVGLGNGGIDKGVVIQRCIGVQVVTGITRAGKIVIPLLL